MRCFVLASALLFLVSCLNPGNREAELQASATCDRQFVGADARGANLTGCVLMPQTNMSNIDFSGAHLSKSVIKEANFTRAILRDTNLAGAQLSGSDFSEAILSRTDFSGADLSGSRFWNANINGAKFNGADLSNANFWNAELIGNDFTGANLKGALLFGAKIAGTIWSNTICPDGINSDQRPSRACN